MIKDCENCGQKLRRGKYRTYSISKRVQFKKNYKLCDGCAEEIKKINILKTKAIW